MNHHTGYNVDFEFARVRQEMMREARQQLREARQAEEPRPNWSGRLSIMLRKVSDLWIAWRRGTPPRPTSQRSPSPAA
jgi:hypothetical protein